MVSLNGFSISTWITYWNASYFFQRCLYVGIEESFVCLPIVHITMWRYLVGQKMSPFKVIVWNESQKRYGAKRLHERTQGKNFKFCDSQTHGALALKINGKIKVISLSLLTLTFDANIYNVNPKHTKTNKYPTFFFHLILLWPLWLSI